MKATLYLETTIPGFLVGGISPVLITAAHQEATQRWWNEERHKYELYVSKVVDDEIAEGIAELARQRQVLIADLPRLAVTGEVTQLAEELRGYLGLPPSAGVDAVHIAVACYHQLDYLLTWNLKHIASAQVRYALARFRHARCATTPTICTPEELLDWGTDT